MRPGRAAAAVATGAVALAAATFGVTEGATDADAPDPGPGFGAEAVADHQPRTQAWARAADDLTAGLEPTSPAACVAGEPGCLDAVIAEMAARLQELGCAHTAPFAFAYLDMTRGVAERLTQGAFFDNPPAVAHFDALFADVYFDAFDNWTAGRTAHVPPVWRMAFSAAEQRAASAPADLLLGMTAHISRDLAYTVASVRRADVDYRRADFLAVDDIIAAVHQPMLDEAGERFDPAVATIEDALLAEGTDVGAVGLISLWRGQALQLGNRLADAADEAARQTIVSEIERRSIATAVLLLNLDATESLGLPPDQRRAHCRQQRDG